MTNTTTTNTLPNATFTVYGEKAAKAWKDGKRASARGDFLGAYAVLAFVHQNGVNVEYATKSKDGDVTANGTVNLLTYTRGDNVTAFANIKFNGDKPPREADLRGAVLRTIAHDVFGSDNPDSALKMSIVRSLRVACYLFDAAGDGAELDSVAALNNHNVLSVRADLILLPPKADASDFAKATWEANKGRLLKIGEEGSRFSDLIKRAKDAGFGPSAKRASRTPTAEQVAAASKTAEQGTYEAMGTINARVRDPKFKPDARTVERMRTLAADLAAAIKRYEAQEADAEAAAVREEPKLSASK